MTARTKSRLGSAFFRSLGPYNPVESQLGAFVERLRRGLAAEALLRASCRRADRADTEDQHGLAGRLGCECLIPSLAARCAVTNAGTR